MSKPNLPTEELKDEVFYIADYLGCNGAELWNELNSLIHHYATKRELEAKISAYDLDLTFGLDSNESPDFKRGFSDAMEKYDAALNNIQAKLKAQKEQENK